MGPSSAATALQQVQLPRRAIHAYRALNEAFVDEALALGRELRGVRVLHLNSTDNGGGVAELLNSVVPLEVDCGLDVEWRLLCPDEQLFAVTKGFHNALQGQPAHLEEEGKRIYLQHNEHCAAMLRPLAYDVVIVHDPQPAAVHRYCTPGPTKWVWRCHIDSSEPDPLIWGFLEPFVALYDAAVFTMEHFVPPGLVGPQLVFIPPAIDPLAPKNRALPRYLCREEVGRFGLDLARPLLVQVARFDPWKDPQGVIEAYRVVKRTMPEVQLALVGSMATDDPEGWSVYDVIRAEAASDPDIHVLTNLNGVGAHEVNAFQREADVVIQKSIREGFGLAVSEAVWKETPVVGGNTGGIPLQIQDGVGGFLVSNVEECADRTLYLLTHPDAAHEIAQKGLERVRTLYLTPRLLRDELRMIHSLLHTR